MNGFSTPEPVDLAEDRQYLVAVASYGDRRGTLIVSQPIYSANGIKLLDKGARIDSRILDRLFGNPLAVALDQCIESEDAVRHMDLLARARELVAASPLLAHLDANLTSSSRVWRALETSPLPPAIAIRLTVIRETAPILYEHSLRCAFIALAIGAMARFSEDELRHLATAALLHDVGMMHADHAAYEGGGPLDVAARRRLHTHPLTGQLIAQHEPQLGNGIAMAISEHHERMDGTGYPRQLRGESISKLGRVLMLADVATGIVERQADQAALRLSLLLRFNHRCFDDALVTGLLAALPHTVQGENAAAAEIRECGRTIALIDSWIRISDETNRQPPGAIGEFIGTRMDRLRRWLVEAGLGDPQAAVLAAKEDAAVCAEMTALARETIWHLRQVAYDASEYLAQQERVAGATVASAAITQWIAAVLSMNPEAPDSTATPR